MCRPKRSDVLCILQALFRQGSEGIITGTVGLNRSVEDGYAAARACALDAVGCLEAASRLTRRAKEHRQRQRLRERRGFPDSPAVINGASDLLVAVFGEAGRHVRAAIGVTALPRNALVEVQMTVEGE